MEKIFDVVKGRRSIRRFEQKEVEKEKLDKILEAARWTPSWANTQCWEIVVVQDDGLKAGLAELLSPKNPATIAVGKAPLTIAICAASGKSGFYKGEMSTKLGDWFMFDLGMLTQTICLTAHALGLGTVVAGFFDHDRAKSLIGVPEGYEVVALVPLGYPDQAPSGPKRRGIDEFVHFDRFGSSS